MRLSQTSLASFLDSKCLQKCLPSLTNSITQPKTNDKTDSSQITELQKPIVKTGHVRAAAFQSESNNPKTEITRNRKECMIQDFPKAMHCYSEISIKYINKIWKK